MAEPAAVDLAAVLQDVIGAHRDRINAAATEFPEKPFVVELNWHPLTRTVETVIRASDRLKPVRVPVSST